MAIQDTRRDYTRAELSEASAHADPVEQFRRWYDDAVAAGLRDPNAMTLATATAAGSPSARTVLLKGFGPEGFAFYTNYESQKARELRENPQASLLFFWPDLERQVRIVGPVSMLSREASEAYFHSRPRGSQLSAWASQQSEPVANRDVLEASAKEVERRFAGGDIPLPPFWGGFALRPTSYEFWQGRPSRLHDRLRYLPSGDSATGWALDRLAP